MKGQLMTEKTGGEKVVNQEPTPKQAETPAAGTEARPAINYPQPTPSGDGKPEEQPAPIPRRAGSYLAVLVASALSGLALAACFFPLSLAWLAWFALVPMLVLVRTRVHPLWVYLCAFVAGSCFFWPALSWMPYSNEFMKLAWYGMSLYCSLYALATVWLLRLLDRRTRIPLILSVPVVWVGLEFLRSFLLTGFPWYFLAHSQHYLLPIIQVADLGGAYTVSFLVVMVNAVIFEWLFLSPRCRAVFRLAEPPRWVQYTRPRWLRWQTAGVAAVVVAALIYGNWRLGQNDFEVGPRLALLQGNIDQNVRNESYEQPTKEILEAVKKAKQKVIAEYDPLWQYAARKFPGQVDLIVWPETSFPGYWRETKKGIAPNEEPPGWHAGLVQIQELMRTFAADLSEANHLIGINTIVLVNPEGAKMYDIFQEFNSALLVHANGTTGGRYDKIHRIPFGEYIPMKDEWPWLAKFTPYDGLGYQLSAGKELKRFQLGKHTFGVLICYEDTDPFLARLYGAEHPDGKPVDFLINISNDGWYAGTSEHNEHLAIARFRAVETRKSVARAVNMGISAVIDPNGRVQQPYTLLRDANIHYWDVAEGPEGLTNLPLAQWNQYKQKTGVLTAEIPIDRRITLYSLWGDWFALACWALVGMGVIMALLPWKKLRPVLAG